MTLLAIYIMVHMVKDLWQVGKCLYNRCSIKMCCEKRAAQEAEEDDLLLTVVKTTAKGQKAHLTDKCPSLKQSTVITTEVKDICRHCRRITLEEILDQKKKIK